MWNHLPETVRAGSGPDLCRPRDRSRAASAAPIGDRGGPRFVRGSSWRALRSSHVAWLAAVGCLLVLLRVRGHAAGSARGRGRGAAAAAVADPRSLHARGLAHVSMSLEDPRAGALALEAAIAQPGSREGFEALKQGSMTKSARDYSGLARWP